MTSANESGDESMPTTQAAPVPNVVLRRHRDARGLTRAEVAKQMNTAAAAAGERGVHVHEQDLYRWETGRVSKASPVNQRLLALVYNVTVAELGFADREPAEPPDPMGALLADQPASTPDPRVTHSQTTWAGTRHSLNTYRAQLATAAAAAYPATARLGGTTLLTTAGWIPDQPVDLEAVDLVFDSYADPAPVDGTGDATTHLRPLVDLVRAYPRYTHAIRDLAHPRLFENRYTWRPTDIAFTGGRGTVRYAPGTYFASMDVHEAVAHEVALVAAVDGSTIGRPAMRDLPFRRHIGDPFDLRRRPVLSSISTLTVRGGPEPSFLLHRRQSKSVAIAGGMLHVIPSGTFQPSSALPAAAAADFDWWRNVQREFSEEILGNAEHNGDGDPVDYRAEPFATLDAARAAGRLRIQCVGLGLDALTLVCEILTVAVFDPDLFDQLAADFVADNDEGAVVVDPVPFAEPTVRRLLDSGRLAPAAAGVLHLAWQHRKVLVG